jgi:TrmH family RNA methyltransferase
MIKYLSSLKMKKYREEYGQFIAEGDKIVRDTLQNQTIDINTLIATDEWLAANSTLTKKVKYIYNANPSDLDRISTFETSPPVIILLDIPHITPDFTEIEHTFSLALDNIQDPGNLGTIIRTADWFGIRNVFCSPLCADLYNPKVIQSSMGAVFNIKVHYSEFEELFKQLSSNKDYTIAGTFMKGDLVSELKGTKNGIIVFGNESQGIKGSYTVYIKKQVTIPAGKPERIHVESLNVASSVAATLALISDTNI